MNSAPGRTLEEAFLEDCEEGEELLDDNAHEIENDDEDDGAIEDIEAEDIDIDDIEDDSEDENKLDVRNVSTLLESEKLANHMAKIKEAPKTRTDSFISGGITNDREYGLIVQSNKIIQEIDSHIFKIHKFMREIYARKFSELEEMVVRPLDYARCVRMIGNKSPEEMADIPLKTVLSGEVAMIVTVSASTSTGKPLSEVQLDAVMDSVDVMLELEEKRQEVIDFVASRMLFIAPNTSALIGTDVASLLIGIAGGIRQLSEIPACNIQVLGAQKKLIGAMVSQIDPHFGVLQNCQLVRDTPRSLKQRAMRMVAAKVAITARVDAHQKNLSSQFGLSLLSKCGKMIEKWQDPPPAKPPRALPIPGERPRRKRGGKRYRKMRERYRVTEAQRMQNRIAFNKAENTIIDANGDIVGLGMLGKEASAVGGKLRKIQSKSSYLEKLNEKIVRKQKRVRARQKLGTNSGITTSLVFTPIQGIELTEPPEKKTKLTSKYFYEI